MLLGLVFATEEAIVHVVEVDVSVHAVVAEFLHDVRAPIAADHFWRLARAPGATVDGMTEARASQLPEVRSAVRLLFRLRARVARSGRVIGVLTLCRRTLVADLGHIV